MRFEIAIVCLLGRRECLGLVLLRERVRDKDFSAVPLPDSTVLGSPHEYDHVAADLTLFRQEMGRKSQALTIYPCIPHSHGDVGTIPRLIGRF